MVFCSIGRSKAEKLRWGGGWIKRHMRQQLKVSYEEIIAPDNLLAAWPEFLPGKRDKKDVQVFGARLTDNIIELHDDLANLTYTHGGYLAFNISDPKPRHIHKATIRDRVLHHAVYRQLYPFFDKTFIADSFSCRFNKGTHKALNRFREFGYQVSRNNTRPGWVLKCDIKKFFANIDHKVLLEILAGYIPDQNIFWLLDKIIGSFYTGGLSKGLPLGNLTSQLFCNIYMNEFDQFVKHKLRAKYYVRYADDFVFLAEDREWLSQLISKIAEFLEDKLKLSLHPDKVFIKTVASGVDFLGWVHFPHHRVLRTTTKRRMMRRIKEHPTEETLQSYLGLLKHGDTWQLNEEVKNLYWLG